MMNHVNVIVMMEQVLEGEIKKGSIARKQVNF